MKTPVSYLLIGISCILSPIHHASHAAPHKKTLRQLETQMLDIKKQLTIEETQREKRYQTLKTTEKKMSQDLHALHQLNEQAKTKQSAIDTLQKNIHERERALKQQEKALAEHVLARHHLGAVHPWQWLMNQKTPQELSRLFVFYQYLFQADQALILKMRDNHSVLLSSHQKLIAEQQQLDALKNRLTIRQKRLSSLKKDQEHLINALNQKIKSKHEQLKTYHQDKRRLQALLNKLKVRPKNEKMTAHLNLSGKRLETPLEHSFKNTKFLNQGLVFLAKEGTPVVSVLPGKVIFSDWLKGYGLLLIIDHGQGVMSLYAHNASLFKASGATVKQGEQIATVGHSGGLRENGLYFEVRRGGRAVPPREWMS